MARIGETVAAIGSTLVATPLALSFGAGATAARNGVLNELHRMYSTELVQRTQDFGPRQIPFNPFDNQQGELLKLKLSGTLSEPIQNLAAYIGLALNLLSAYGYFRSNRNSLTSNVRVLGPLRPLADIVSTLSLAMAPSLLLSMIEQYKYLQTATHLGATEAIMTFIPALLVAPALLKVPSIVEGTGHLLNDAVIRPIAGAVRGMKNTRRREERQVELDAKKAKERMETESRIETSRNLNGGLDHLKKERKNMPKIRGLYPIGLSTDEQSASPVDLKKQLTLPPPVGLDLPSCMIGAKSPSKKTPSTGIRLPRIFFYPEKSRRKELLKNN